MARHATAQSPRIHHGPQLPGILWARMETTVSPFPRTPQPEPAKLSGTTLCLSGGGYRAMVYHIGALKRLNEAGWLPRIDIISSVSGGSIAAGALAVGWRHLRFDNGIATNLDDVITEPLRQMSRKTIDISAGLRGMIIPGAAGRRVARAYDRTLLHKATLQDLPDQPEFAFNATNYQSGVRWAFGKNRMGDYRVGYVRSPKTRLSTAVAASSGFPPVLAPLLLKTNRLLYEPGPYSDLLEAPYHKTVVLADGGVYDNLGLEPAKNSATILVSNGSGPAGAEADPSRRWIGGFLRTVSLINRQVRSLRKRLLFEAGDQPDGPTVGYWHIWMDYSKFHDLADKLPVDRARARQLAGWPTRLKNMDQPTFEGLVNWGYASCDVVLRTWVDRATKPPRGFPYPRGV